MDTSAALSVGLTRTPARGWAVVLLSRLQTSSIMLTSFTLGVFLPFIRQDLQLSPLQAGLLQGVSWMATALMALPSGVWCSRFRPVPLVFVSLLLSAPFLDGMTAINDCARYSENLSPACILVPAKQ